MATTKEKLLVLGIKASGYYIRQVAFTIRLVAVTYRRGTSVALHQRKRWPILTHGPKTPKALLYSLILCYLPTKPNTFMQFLCIPCKLLINLLLICILFKNLFKPY